MTVLWHAEVEREPPRRIAPVLGMEPGAVSALLLRARKGLREAYLTVYAQAPPTPECEPTFPYIAATVLGTGSARNRRKVAAHTRDCEDCAKVLAELSDVGKSMRGILAPLILVPSGVVLPYARLLPKYSTGAYTAILTAASVFVAAAAVCRNKCVDTECHAHLNSCVPGCLGKSYNSRSRRPDAHRIACRTHVLCFLSGV